MARRVWPQTGLAYAMSRYHRSAPARRHTYLHRRGGQARTEAIGASLIGISVVVSAGTDSEVEPPRAGLAGFFSLGAREASP